jgi:superfamily II DNA or RNA helicase
MISLRPYQQVAVNEIRNNFREGSRSVLLCLATGAGKTYTFSYIAQGAGKKGNSVVILVHRQELVMQSSLSLAKIGVRHSLVTAASVAGQIKVNHVRELGQCFIDSTANVCVASIGTIVRRLDQIKAPDLIIPDEAHHATAGQWRAILDHWPNAKVLGVTATPIRTDGVGLGTHAGGVFDSMVLGPTVQELIDMGSLVPPKVFFPGQMLDLSGVRVASSGDFNQKDLAAKIAEKPSIVGDAVDHYRKLAPGKKAVAFCVSVAAAQAQAEAFNRAGFKFKSLDGSLDDSERRQVVRDLVDGRIDGITSCDIVSEGFDLPALEVAILLRPTQSLSLYLQQVGRVLRPSDGKSFGIVIDAVGNTINHGLPHWDRDWTLDGKAKKKKAANDNVPPVQVKVCPQCFSVQRPAAVCVSCGHTFEVKTRELEQVDGELHELNEQHELMLRKQKRQEVGKARTLEDLEAIAAQRGYSKGWARHVYKARGGRAA